MLALRLSSSRRPARPCALNEVARRRAPRLAPGIQWKRGRRLAVLVCVLASARAYADDTMEVGLFGGGFISNYFHQFYDVDKFPLNDRPLISRVSPELGLRYNYFFHPNIGGEGERSMIMTSTQGMTWAGEGAEQSASIYILRAQLILQLPLADLNLYPFAAVGIGMMHTSSDFLRSDTDYPLHVGAGVRWVVSDSIAVRADARFLRGPSEQHPYTLNASYDEFMVGVSWTPTLSTGTGGDEEPPPPPPPVDKDSDGDGIPDSLDKCPIEPEDKDMYQDDDCCPDLDNDGDGIPDAQDKCPLDPEDKDGFQDDDGCPDKDNAGDGNHDNVATSPNEPEDNDGFQAL